MGVEKPSPQIVDSIQSAIRWFEKSKLTGVKVLEKPDAAQPKVFEHIVVKDPNAPPLWARFYRHQYKSSDFRRTGFSRQIQSFGN